MKSSTDLLLRVQKLLGSLGAGAEQLDEVSRDMLLHVSEAQGNGKTVRVSNICRIERFGSFPTAHRRLKKLLQMGLVQSDHDPVDARVQVLSLTPKTRKQIDKIAEQIKLVVCS